MSATATAKDDDPSEENVQRIILFYKYHPLADEPHVTEEYRAALEDLCRSLHLLGRILVGHSRNEGINGTLSGDYKSVRAFTCGLMNGDDGDALEESGDREAVRRYRVRSDAFFLKIGVPPLAMKKGEFKWSTSNQTEPLFPDLNVKLVKELISSGGQLQSIPLEETAQGYLSPREWHDELSKLSSTKSNDTVLIDCRNTKEFEIGHFEGALDPRTTTFSQFPKWVNDNQHLLAEKRVLLYCNGGIRCEKASAFIRREVEGVKDVRHLQGGIHKYLEDFGEESDLWKGKNFVFDSRGAASAQETRHGKEVSVNQVTDSEGGSRRSVVGKCFACHEPYDEFDPHCVCSVCREPTLVCRSCQRKLAEYHCAKHEHLRKCYFSNLEPFSAFELDGQLSLLESFFQEIAVGRRFKQRRRTLLRQMERVRVRQRQLSDRASGMDSTGTEDATTCRSCGESGCVGRCWGFYGMKRKQLLDSKSSNAEATKLRKLAPIRESCVDETRLDKDSKRVRFVEEVTSLNLSQTASANRDERISVRVPPVVTRVVYSNPKAKWCGLPITQVMREQFVELSRPQALQKVLEKGLLRINGRPVDVAYASGVRLKTSDVVSRVLHWHEPPVIVPSHIEVNKVALPSSIASSYGATGDLVVYVCNKPSSVPVHPSGPYLANTLTLMVEAQESLDCRSLIPLHRTDRATSGLTLLGTDPVISRVFHTSLCAGDVRKLYIAKVHGKFVTSIEEFKLIPRQDTGTCQINDDTLTLEVDAPVETVDPIGGLRAVSIEGKSSRSLFRLLDYAADENTSLVLCSPLSGRNHQLRVHLQWLGFPILGDSQYGGSALNDTSDDFRDRVMSLMERSVGGPHLPELTAGDIDAAREVCDCCIEGGVTRSFTKAQLLQGGHSIRLHALRYSLAVRSRKQGAAREEVPETIEFSVSPPSWVDSSLLQAVTWLD